MTDQPKTNVFDLMVSTKSAVKDLDIPSAEEVNAIMTNLMNWVALDLENRNIAGAMHKMSIAEAYETYWKRLMKSQPGLILHKNTVAAHRYMGLYDLGVWLEPKIAKNKKKLKDPRSSNCEDLIWQDDLDEWGITRTIRAMTRWLYQYGEEDKLNRHKVKDFLFSYTHRNGDSGLPYELDWGTVLRETKPAKAETQSVSYIIPSQITTTEGQKFYKWMRIGKTVVINYVNRIREGDVTPAEIIVLTGLPFWGNIFSVWSELKKLVKVADRVTDEDKQS